MTEEAVDVGMWALEVAHQVGLAKDEDEQTSTLMIMLSKFADAVRAEERTGLRAVTVWSHVLAALRGSASERCHKKSCGTVCLCTSCHARKALEVLDPAWTP